MRAERYKMTTHTPAPWKADTVVNSEDLHMEVYIPNRTLAYVLHYPNDITTDETAANARLIAAAPELLEALKALENLTNIPAFRQAANKAGYMAQFSTAKDTARAAIAKAEGN